MRSVAWSALAVAALCAACGSKETPSSSYLDRDALMDPESCKQCHAQHVTEWSGSMHAYAADDPVFLAMNARGQRETKGELGDFCVKCHAPMAVRTGQTTDGLNLAQLPQKLKGVTCYFCHSVASVEGTHDNPLTLADDNVMRAGIADPVHNTAHRAAYSGLHDRNSPDSAKLCGACHDIVSPAGAAIERTYDEWQHSLFSSGKGLLACGSCHMDGRNGVAADAPGVKVRRVHSHTFPGVDVALGDFPEKDAQQQAVQNALDTRTLQSALCVRHVPGGAQIQVILDNVGAGHNWPSGATQDRRAWVEVIAYSGSAPIYQSGVVADGDSVTASADPDLWLVRDCMFDGQDQLVHMFWQAAGVEGNPLPAPVTFDQTNPDFYLTHVYRMYPRETATQPTLATVPDRVTMRVRIRPIGLDVIDDLVASKDLDPSVKARIPTFDLASTKLEWTKASATIHYPDGVAQVDCVSGGLASGKNANPAAERTKCSP